MNLIAIDWTKIVGLLKDWGLQILTLFLVVATFIYAWQTRKTIKQTEKLAEETKKLADATVRMADEPKKLADISHKAYLFSLAPEVECSRKAPGKTACEFYIKNKGRYPITWHKIVVHYSLEGNQHNEKERIVDQQILPKDIKEAGIDWPPNSIVDDTIAEIVDSAGEMYKISLSKAPIGHWD
jgi:archaellum component FlaG (FlaF/FlaG flagellin family)